MTVWLQQLDMPSRLTVVLVSLLLATPAVLFWLWLVILPARVAILCPEGCSCETGGYYVDCYKMSLNNIPLNFPTNIRTLLLTGNSITSLERNCFASRGLTELEEIMAINCEIKTIQLGAFNGLTKLTHLSIPFNKIREIITGTFQKMGRLEYLDLGSNRIQHLEVGVLSGLINLKSVHLEANDLQYLNPDLFIGLPNLVQLQLAQNADLHVPTEHNFIRSHSLSRLDISYCNVSSVSVETFANVTALERLDLSYNNLSSVDINILKSLPKLSALYLYNNPLQCDCQLLEVWRWCQDHNIRTASGETAPECATPSEVQGMWWGVLEKGQCSQDDTYYYGDYENTSYSYSEYKGIYIHIYMFFKNTRYSYSPNDSYQSLGSFAIRYHLPVYAVPFIFGTTGNVILLIIITCNKHMRTVPNMYILNLAISNIIYLMVHFSDACADTIPDTWQYGDFTCRFSQFCRRLSVGLSAYSVAVLSIQRYRVTVNPLHVRVSSQQTWRATVATFCAVWIVAALFAIPSALSEHKCHEIPFMIMGKYYRRVVLFELLVSCVLPLCVIAVSYIMTARHLLKSARPISEETQIPRLNTRTNTAKIVLGLAVVFLISYVPYHCFWTYVIFCEGAYPRHLFSYTDNYLQYTYRISSCLLLINPCLNPVALFCTGRAFRRQFKRYLTCCCKANSTATDIELTRRN